MNGEAMDHRECERLLRHLGREGSFAVLSPLGCGRIALFRDTGGTSLGAGYVAPAAADALLQSGQAAWCGEGRGRRLMAVSPEAGSSAADGGHAAKEATVQGMRMDDRESPLLWLHRRVGKDGKPQISATQFAAGERFRADLTLAQMLPRTTMNWDAALAPGARDVGARDRAGGSDTALAARQRVRAACDRLGPELSGLAIDVCGFLRGLDQVERERGWPARSAKIVLRLALNALAMQYGIEIESRRVRRHAPWLAKDARPTIAPAEGRA